MANDQTHKSLVRADKVLTSLRASDFDTESAFGEVIDNALQAGAKNIHIHMKEEQKIIGQNTNPSRVYTEVAFGDDGCGMNANILHECLQLGSSTRYNDRSGIGRFGVGATLAAISQCKKISIYSRENADTAWLMTYIDLDEIANGAMEYIPEPCSIILPEEYKNLVGLESGSLVIWQKCDAIESDPSGHARWAETLCRQLTDYVARTYRKFIYQDIHMILNNESIIAYDPLYVMPDSRFPEDDCAIPDEPIEILWPIPNRENQTSKVIIQTSLLPKSLRPREGSGGKVGRPISRQNRGISILRANREIAYSIFPDMQPSVRDNEIDRYWGCEISFEPELDECWNVRNIKKGAKPITSLREAIKMKIDPVIKTFRREIRQYWNEVKQQELERNPHHDAEEIAANSDLLGQHQQDEGFNTNQIQDLLNILDQISNIPERKEQIKEKIKNQPFTIEDNSWPGQEFIDIKYFGGNVVMVFNRAHPFFEEFYSRIEQMIDSEQDAREIADMVRTAINLLLVAFANAQRAHGEEQYYDNLRTHWGMDLRRLVNNWKNKSEQ